MMIYLTLHYIQNGYIHAKSDLQLQNRPCSFILDVNECAENTYTCDQNADCVNTVGSYTCRCRARYNGDGYTCTAGKAIANNYISPTLGLLCGPMSSIVA